MKRYNNLAFRVSILLPIGCIGALVEIILGCVFYNGDFFGIIAMCTTLFLVIIMAILVLFLLKDSLIVTYYDEQKMVQKNILIRKQINYEDIKEIYVSGSYIYFTSKVYNLEFDESRKIFLFQRKVYKMLKNEIVIMITSDPIFLKYLSLEEINIHKF